MSRHAAEWGLAALLIAGFQLLLVPGIVLIGIGLWGVLKHDDTTGAGDAVVFCWLARLGVGFSLTLCVLNLLIAIKACVSARKRQQPAALPFAGLLLALVTLPVWILGAIALLYATENLRIHYQLPEDLNALQGVWTKASVVDPQGQATPTVELHIGRGQLRLQTEEPVAAGFYLKERWNTYLHARWGPGEAGEGDIAYTLTKDQLQLAGKLKGYDVSGTWQRKKANGP